MKTVNVHEAKTHFSRLIIKPQRERGSSSAALGRLDLPETLLETMESEGMEELPVAASHALAVQRLPGLHRDPFGRMLMPRR